MAAGHDDLGAGSSSFRLALCLLLAGWLVIAGYQLTRPHAMGVDEVQVANLVWYWQHGQLPYGDHHQPPVPFNPYGPLHPWLTAQVAALGVAPLLAARLLALLPLLAALALGVRWLASTAGRSPWPWLVAALLLASRPGFVFALRARVDGLAVALALTGFLVGLRARGRPSALLAALLLTAAALTKATMVSAPVALLAALWPTRRRRGLVIYALWLLLLAAAIGILQAATDGCYLAGLARPIEDWGRCFEVAFRPISTTGPWLVWVLLAWRSLPPATRREGQATCWYSWLALLVAAASGIACGSSWNYLLEFYASLAVGSAWLAAQLLQLPAARRPPAWPLTLQVALSLVYLPLSANPVPAAVTHAAAYQAARSRLQPLVAAGQRLAIVGNPAAAEALLDLGQPNGLDEVDCMALDRSAAGALAGRALASGKLDQILCGPELRPWRPTQ
ncbi:MAG: hypothetical protein IT204_21685 [Fimbriimonadaceae bacterium]|nr:hypothetical protein [Fimbriimonadaceae bacterium]